MRAPRSGRRRARPRARRIARRRSRRARSARRRIAVARSARRQTRHPPVPTTRIRTAQGFYTNDLSCSAATGRRYAAPRFHRTEVGRERVGHPAEAVHRRRVRRLDIGRDHGGSQSRDRRGHRRGAARHGGGRRARRDRGEEGVGRVAGQDAEGPHGAPARSSPTSSTRTPRSSRGWSRSTSASRGGSPSTSPA